MTGFTYPAEVGGQGGEAWQERIYDEEAVNYEGSSGFIRSTIAMLGPTLMAYGTDEQKRELVPRLLSGEDAWCQLFSEPGAGSDLASLGCRAVRDGDEFVVTGQKVWNSAAQWCDHGMLLARTDPDAPKHHGITFLLIDMASPGIEARPLIQATGAAHFNEVFFENVRVPVASVLGEIDGGWAAARTVMANESAMIGGSGGGTFPKLLLLAELFDRTDDPVVRQRLADGYVRDKTLGLLAERIMGAIRRRERPPVDPSILKLSIAAEQARSRETSRSRSRGPPESWATTRSVAGWRASSSVATASRSAAAPTKSSATTSPNARSGCRRSPAPTAAWRGARPFAADRADLGGCGGCSTAPVSRPMRSPAGRSRRPIRWRCSTSTVARSPTASCTPKASAGPRPSRPPASPRATTSPPCCRTTSTRTARCSGSRWLRVVEVPLNGALTGRLLRYSLDLAEVTTIVVAPEYADAVHAVRGELPALQRIIVLDDAERAAFLAGGDTGADAPEGPEYRDVHSLMFTSGTTGPSKAVVTPWAVMYQFWSWVPDDTLAAGEGLYCTMPLFHNSGRSAFNYAHGPRRALRRPRQVQQRTLLGRRARHELRDRRARRADDRVPRRRSPVARRRRQPAAERDRGADDPRDGGVRASLRRAGRDRVRADRGRHGRHHRLGPRPVGQLRPRARGLPVARGPDRGRARRAGRHRRGRRDDRAQRRAVEPEPRLLPHARADGRRVAQRLVPHRRRVPAATPTAGSTSSTASATRSGDGARTSRRSRWRPS